MNTLTEQSNAFSEPSSDHSNFNFEEIEFKLIQKLYGNLNLMQKKQFMSHFIKT